MAAPPEDGERQRLYVFNGGFFRERVRRILYLAGYDVIVGNPPPDGLVGVWGQSPTAHRGEWVSDRAGAQVIRIEDAFMRSLFPGRTGSDPIGLLVDDAGVHFDPAQPSALERLLRDDPLDDTILLNRARAGIALMKEAHLTKYTAFDVTTPPPDPGYVLVIDQTRDDASVTASKGDRNRFREMLFVAQEEHPGAPVLIKTHPESQQGLRAGYYDASDESDRVQLFDTPMSPWSLLEGAVAVYTLSSQFGFEAIFAGHRPRVFGQPFYAGWGLTDDEVPLARRQRRLTRAQLFAAAMIKFPKWYDPCLDRLCSFEEAAHHLSAETDVWRADHKGWAARGMRMWKRPHLQKFFGQHKRLRFGTAPEVSEVRQLVWGVPEAGRSVGVEDGFVRSRGLGAELVPPLSLVTDDAGIYYDPSRPSRLEALIDTRRELRPDQETRARAVIKRLIKGGISKYNLSGGTLPPLPDGKRILVVGQVEDDASVRLGTGAIATNAALCAEARTAHPDDILIYKPHPDVVAGLRSGAFEAGDIVDEVVTSGDVIPLLEQVDAVWTMTSLTGFEALLRAVPVTTTGAPFYAGYGLTTDRGKVPPRRKGPLPLTSLVHAVLIDYPRYIDPVTGRPCPIETILTRIESDELPTPGRFNRTLSKLQGLFASVSHFWR